MRIKVGLVAFLVHQPLLFHCPARAKLIKLSSIPPALPEIDIACNLVLESNSDADFSGVEHVLSLDSDHFALFDACVLPFLLGQIRRARKIEFYNISGLQRGRQRHFNKNAGLADVAASAVKESVSFRQPNADWPCKSASAFLTLFC